MTDREDEPNWPTIERAERAGLLYRLGYIDPLWGEQGLFSHASSQLLRSGYTVGSRGQDEGIDALKVIDLLNQCNEPLKSDYAKGELGELYLMKVRFPDGQRHQVYVQFNCVHRFTIMLAQDYRDHGREWGISGIDWPAI